MVIMLNTHVGIHKYSLNVLVIVNYEFRIFHINIGFAATLWLVRPMSMHFAIHKTFYTNPPPDSFEIDNLSVMSDQSPMGFCITPWGHELHTADLCYKITFNG